MTITISTEIWYLIVGLVVGVGGTWLYYHWFDIRTPSQERAFRRMWRVAKRMKLTSADLEDVFSPLDIKGDRVLPLLREIHKEELTLEQGTECLDKLRARLNGGNVPEYTHGWRRSLVGRKAMTDLDQRTQLPRIPTVGGELEATDLYEGEQGGRENKPD